MVVCLLWRGCVMVGLFWQACIGGKVYAEHESSVLRLLTQGRGPYAHGGPSCPPPPPHTPYHTIFPVFMALDSVPSRSICQM